MIELYDDMSQEAARLVDEGHHSLAVRVLGSASQFAMAS